MGVNQRTLSSRLAMAAPRPKTQGSQTRCSHAAAARTQVLRAGPTSAAHTGRLTNLDIKGGAGETNQ